MGKDPEGFGNPQGLPQKELRTAYCVHLHGRAVQVFRNPVIDTQYAIRSTQCAVRSTQYAVRNYAVDQELEAISATGST